MLPFRRNSLALFTGYKEGRLKRLWCYANLVSSQHSSCPYGQHTKLSVCWLFVNPSVNRVGLSFARRVSVRLGGFCVTEVCPPLKRPTCKVCMANTVQEVTRSADQNVHEQRCIFETFFTIAASLHSPHWWLKIDLLLPPLILVKSVKKYRPNGNGPLPTQTPYFKNTSSILNRFQAKDK